ncbi:MAG: GNAT family N-acetyltransferase [Roseiflexaceae bacterium]
MTHMHEQDYRENLGDGYTLRWANRDDDASLVALYDTVFDDNPLYVSAYVMAQIAGTSPVGVPDDVAVVSDEHNRIVAATLLLRMPIDYAGVAVPAGRPEIVATHPEVRNRGFVRRIFQLIHARSAYRGDLLQGITGIPYYYRQFGYEYALTLGGNYQLPFSSIPAGAPDQSDTISLRRATNDDIMPLLMLYERDKRRIHNHQPMLVTSRVDATYMRHTIHTTQSHDPWVPYLIVSDNDTIVGSIFTNRMRFGAIEIRSLTTEPHVPLHTIFDALCRQIMQLALTMPANNAHTSAPSEIQFWLGVAHPAYPLIARSPHQVNRPYGWYIRVADIARLLQHIVAPLEKRLSQSSLAGYTGTLQIEMYRDGLQIDIVKGKITAQAWKRNGPWQSNRSPGAPQAAYPPLVILQQIFGLHSLAELRDFYPDVYASHEAYQLLDVLFPKQASWLLPLD